ncbi:HelD family protein [Streptomyces virginiae]|uniref:HelD family protein n=1 Tax=Streptomyces virginiae TaxID=1961 RepID=UPI0038687394|nr:AAA family ATPase [Streptomyces virginiae]
MAGTRRRAIIAREQENVDLAYSSLEARRAADVADDVTYRVQNEMPAPGSARAGAGLGSADEPLVIMRVSTRTGDSFLVGRQAVWSDMRDLVVLSSATQKVVDWRLATEDDPGELLLRRKLQFKPRKPDEVTGCFDELRLRHYDEGVDQGMVVENPTTIAEATAHVASEESAESKATSEGSVDGVTPSLESLLLDDLDLPRDGTLRDIVETVQREQLLLVAHRRSGALVIQGGPGTGKTAVGLYRVMWLLDNQHCAADQVLVVGPHQGFLDYAGRVLPALGGGDVTTITLQRLFNGDRSVAPTTSHSPEARFVKADDRMADVLRRAVEANCRPTRSRVSGLLADSNEPEAVFRFMCKGRMHQVGADTLLDVAREALYESAPFNVRQGRFRLRVAGKLLLSVPGGTPQDILASKEVAAFIQRVWPRLNTTDVYERLLDSPKLLEAAGPLLTAEERSALRRPRAAKAEWDAADLVCLDELDWLLNGAGDRRTFAHIVVDEAQDLTPMEARALARRCPTGSMTILGDLAQAAGPHEYLSWRELAALLTAGAPWTVEVLQAGFRLPPEVAEFVEPLARAAAPRVPAAQSVRPARGKPVQVRHVDAHDELAEAVARCVAATVTAQDGRSTAVIAPADSGLLRRIGAELIKTGVTADVPLLEPHEAKGIEFDHVVVVEPAAIAGRTPSGMRSLYVALTRCTQSLIVIHHEPLPVPIGPGKSPVPLPAVAPSPGDVPSSMIPTQPVRPVAEAASDLDDFLRTAVEADRKQPVHERLRHKLLARLWEVGEPEQGSTADVLRTDGSSTQLFEVLHVEHATYGDLRDAAARTAEIRFTLDRAVDRTFLVCAAPPVEAWAVGAVEGAFGVSVIWWESGAWQGRDATVLAEAHD